MGFKSISSLASATNERMAPVAQPYCFVERDSYSHAEPILGPFFLFLFFIFLVLYLSWSA